MILNYSQASENNKRPILEKLFEVFEQTNDVLEIGSGSGQHAIHFAKHFPDLSWQTSELADGIEPLEQNIENHAPDNVLKPVLLDVCNNPWPIKRASAIYTANSLHIMSWTAVEALFKGIGQVLDDDGLLCIYGPFKYNGEFTTSSNAQFDLWLKERDRQSGVRDFEAVNQLARQQRLSLIQDYPMPANNQFLIFKRNPES